ncbi:MAG: hypothetical protein GXO39_04260 [Thermotogae bacterium]|nr:hypothetical protein [Thermotogota bacterium]
MINFPEVPPRFKGVVREQAVTVSAASTTPTALEFLNNTEIALIANTSADTTVYLGSSAVTTSTGFPLQPGQTMVLYKEKGVPAQLFAVSTADVELRILELE